MYIDEAFMAEVGLDEMPRDEQRAFMEHAKEELEVRVGHAVSRELNPAKLQECEQIDDNEQAATWLKMNVPNFREIIQQVFQSFKTELVAERARILG